MNTKKQRTSTINFGDKRLNKRYEHIVEAAIKNPTASFPSAFKDWKALKATYRFFDNDKTDLRKILNNEQEATIKTIQELEKETDILVLQDSSDLDYTNHSSKKDLGKTQRGIKHGLIIHPTIATTPSRINLGLLDAKMWTRHPAAEGELCSRAHRNRPIEEKESYCWIESFKKTQEVAKKCPNKRFINIGDRAADIYELFMEANDQSSTNAFFIVRSYQKRKTTNPNKTLRKAIENAPVAASLEFILKRGKERRKVKQTVRFKELEIASPVYKPSLKPLKLNAVFAQEVAKNENGAPIESLLLTNLPIKSGEDAIQVIKYGVVALMPQLAPSPL